MRCGSLRVSQRQRAVLDRSHGLPTANLDPVSTAFKRAARQRNPATAFARDHPVEGDREFCCVGPATASTKLGIDPVASVTPPVHGWTGPPARRCRPRSVRATSRSDPAPRPGQPRRRRHPTPPAIRRTLRTSPVRSRPDGANRCFRDFVGCRHRVRHSTHRRQLGRTHRDSFRHLLRTLQSEHGCCLVRRNRSNAVSGRLD